MAAKKKGNKGDIKLSEATDIQSLVINMYKEGYLDGYIRGIGKDPKNMTIQDKNSLWDTLKKKARKDFEKFIKYSDQKEVKGGKNKNGN